MLLNSPCVYEYPGPGAENQQLDFSLFISLDVSLFHPSLTSPPQNAVIFVLVFFITLPAVFFPLTLSLALMSQFFFSSNFFSFPLPCHFLSLSFRPASLPTVIFHLLPPPCLSLPQQNKAGIVLRDGSCSKLKYHYPFDCHLDVLENFAGFYFAWKSFLLANAPADTQWIVLILHNFRFIHLRQA